MDDQTRKEQVLKYAALASSLLIKANRHKAKQISEEEAEIRGKLGMTDGEILLAAKAILSKRQAFHADA